MTDPVVCIECGAMSYNDPGKTPIRCATCWETLQAERDRFRDRCAELEMRLDVYNGNMLDVLQSELAALKDRMEGVCRWSLENDDYNIWKGDCGAEWTLETDDPVTNGMNYCPKCGKHLEQIDPEPPEAE